MIPSTLASHPLRCAVQQRRTLRTILFASVALLSACRTRHLSPDTNVASREAWAAQRQSDPEKTPTFGADDAKRTNAVRRGDPKQGGGTTVTSGAALLPGAIMSTTNGGGAGQWPGAKGNITLEAK
ncbi:MAG: hypothetical protein SFX73_20310 [Kofleriaceae bacterium]|nr:hypothetical protein [Kofleriaceae bacterium]